MMIILIFVDVVSATSRPDIVHFIGQVNFIFIKEMSGNCEKGCLGQLCLSVEHFTVVCSVTWPLNGSEAEGDLVLMRTSLLLLCKSSCFYSN